ncbi:MAG TPA: hypothetical protein VEU96_32400 [Bryobacteraceae bacterium]|nr:hypothetical protein [Bryobacteraceae bacterium]
MFFDPTGITAALGSAKVILDLLKNAKDAQLAMGITREVANVQGQLIGVQQQALQLQAENQELKNRLNALDDDKHFRDSLDYDAAIGVYRRKDSKGREEIYCSTCLDSDNKRVRTSEERSTVPPTLVCHIHGYRQ